MGGCFGKRHELDVTVDLVVDDDASVVESYGGYRVEPFEGDPWDEELLRVAEAVVRREPRAAGPARRYGRYWPGYPYIRSPGLGLKRSTVGGLG